MEELSLMWDYETKSVEELTQELLHASLEIESASKTNMELLHCLSIASKERDELREHVVKLQNMLTPSSNIPTQHYYSNTLSHSYGSSSDFSNTNVVQCSSSNLGYVQTYNFCSPRPSLKNPELFSTDRVLLAKGKAVPEKGKL